MLFSPPGVNFHVPSPHKNFDIANSPVGAGTNPVVPSAASVAPLNAEYVVSLARNRNFIVCRIRC